MHMKKTTPKLAPALFAFNFKLSNKNKNKNKFTSISMCASLAIFGKRVVNSVKQDQFKIAGSTKEHQHFYINHIGAF